MKQKKRKILVIHHSPLGGSAMSLLYTVEELKKTQEFDFVIICRIPETVNFYRKHGIKTYFCDFPLFTFTEREKQFNLFTLSALIKSFLKTILLPIKVYPLICLIRRINPDIVHLNSSVMLAGMIAARIARKKIVWHIREPLTKSYKKYLQKAVGALIRHSADAVVAISEYEAAQLGDNTKNNVYVLYNFVDFSLFDYKRVKNSFKKELGLKENDKIVVSLGGLLKIKGAYNLIQAVQHFTRDDIYLVFAGCDDFSPSKDTSIKKRIKKFLGHVEYSESIHNLVDNNDSLKQRCFFLPHRTDIPDILSASDVVYFGGTIPHFARPVFEAWTMKKPVVAVFNEETALFVKHEYNGLLVDRNDYEKLAASIERLIENSEFSNQIAENGYAIAQKCFNAQNNISLLHEIYSNLC